MKGFDKDVEFVFDVTENRKPFLVSEEMGHDKGHILGT